MIPIIMVLKYQVRYLSNCQRWIIPAIRNKAHPNTPTTIEGV
jgi:hypothetical protein